MAGQGVAFSARQRKGVSRFEPTMKPDNQLLKEAEEAEKEASQAVSRAQGGQAQGGNKAGVGAPGHSPRDELNKHGRPKQPNQYTKGREERAKDGRAGRGGSRQSDGGDKERHGARGGGEPEGRSGEAQDSEASDGALASLLAMQERPSRSAAKIPLTRASPVV